MTSPRLRNLAACAALAVVVLLLYGHTLDVPWYLDDLPVVANNLEIRHILPWQRIFAPRGPGFLSFSLNYVFGGGTPAGFHAVNIGIHILTGCLAWLVLKRLVASRWLALLGAALFVAHPVQTQAVTYVVQRFTSLAGLFFMLALYLFIRAIEAYDEGADKLSVRHILWYLSAVAAGAAAVFTKQNTAVLPVILFLYCRFFRNSREPLWSTAVYIAPFLIAPLYAALGQFVLPVAAGESLQRLTGTDSFSNTRTITPFTYFITELGVIWLYLRLLVLPVGLRLEYDLPILPGIDGGVVVAGAGLLLLGAAAVAARKRFPLLSFGIAWFLLTLAVESTFIPLDPVFEHRLYLPTFGFVLILLELLWLLPRRTSIGLCSVIVVLCGVLTWQRNDLWRRPLDFYADNIRKAPKNPRPYLPVARQYLVEGKTDEALALLERGLAADPGSYLIYNVLGLVYEQRGDLPAAISHFRTAVSLNPKFPEGYTNLGAAFAAQGKWREAEESHLRALRIQDNYALAHFNLGVAQYNLGKKREAFASFRRAAELSPADGDALYNAAIAAVDIGDMAYAANALPRLRSLNAAKGAALAAEISKQELRPR